jgi:hypothetical protein
MLRAEMLSTIMILLGLLPAQAGAQAAQTEDDKTAVLATVQKFFDTMAARDVEGARLVLLPEGRTFSVREQNGQPVARASSIDDYLAGLAKGKSASRERMWNPEVRIHGPIASVWTPYDFWVDGKFSHCGIDVFTLVKTSEGWKISSGAWTIERTGCTPSPLGPLK